MTASCARCQSPLISRLYEIFELANRVRFSSVKFPADAGVETWDFCQLREKVEILDQLNKSEALHNCILASPLLHNIAYSSI